MRNFFNLVVIKKIKGTPGEKLFAMPNVPAENVTDAVKHCKDVCGISSGDDLIVLQEDSYHQSVMDFINKNKASQLEVAA